MFGPYIDAKGRKVPMNRLNKSMKTHRKRLVNIEHTLFQMIFSFIIKNNGKNLLVRERLPLYSYRAGQLKHKANLII